MIATDFRSLVKNRPFFRNIVFLHKVGFAHDVLLRDLFARRRIDIYDRPRTEYGLCDVDRAEEGLPVITQKGIRVLYRLVLFCEGAAYRLVFDIFDFVRKSQCLLINGFVTALGEGRKAQKEYYGSEQTFHGIIDLREEVTNYFGKGITSSRKRADSCSTTE